MAGQKTTGQKLGSFLGRAGNENAGGGRGQNLKEATGPGKGLTTHAHSLYLTKQAICTTAESLNESVRLHGPVARLKVAFSGKGARTPVSSKVLIAALGIKFI